MLLLPLSTTAATPSTPCIRMVDWLCRAIITVIVYGRDHSFSAKRKEWKKKDGEKDKEKEKAKHQWL